MFVSRTREEIAALIEDGLSLNEIAHRLGLANATVGYHARALREGENGPSSQNRHASGGPPRAAPTVTRERVRRLLERGYTRAQVADALGIARSTVTYHAGRLGHHIDQRCARRYDWGEIRRFYEDGHSAAECQSHFGFDRHAWYDAIGREAIIPRPARLPLEELLIAGPRRNRNHLKRRLFDAGIKTRRCEACGLTQWRGAPVPLALHHVNGDRHDNRLENLEILCPNCHGLTDTWSGRNIPRLRASAVTSSRQADDPPVLRSRPAARSARSTP
jgi:DNA-binding CsgD family transcriptional regulator